MIEGKFQDFLDSMDLSECSHPEDKGIVFKLTKDHQITDICTFLFWRLRTFLDKVKCKPNSIFEEFYCKVGDTGFRFIKFL